MILLDLVALEIDPNVVKPGWTPLLITVGIALIMVLLFVSMRRQFRNIDVGQSQPDDAEVPPPSSPTSTPTTPSSTTPTSTPPAPPAS